jgi:hypothetical protein
MHATAFGAQVENTRGSFPSPSARTTYAVSRVCPAFRIPRSSSAIFRNESASSIRRVGAHAETPRNSAAGLMFPETSGFTTSCRSTINADDLPRRFVGEKTARIGLTPKVSWQCVYTTQSASAV